MFLLLFCFFFVGVLPCVFRRKCIDVVSIETQRERWENVRNLFLDDVGSVCGTVQVGWTDVVVCFFFLLFVLTGRRYRNQVYCMLSVAGDMCVVEESPFGSVAKDLCFAASELGEQ